MNSIKKLPLLVALAATQMPLAVMAQEDDDVALDELVVTGTRGEAPILWQAGNTGRLSQEQIDFIEADHVSEAVNRMSGVNVQRGNGQEHLTSIRSPVLTGGAGAGSFLYLEDGIPLRAAGFANVNGLFEVNHEQAGGIEVVRGPGSALYGSNAVHGMINVLTRAPSLDLQREIDLSVGPNDLYQAKGTVSDTIGKHGYRVSVNGTTDGGYAEDAGYDNQKVTLRHDYYGDKDYFKTVFSAINLNQNTQGYVPGFKAYEDPSLSRANYYGGDAYRNAEAYRLSTEWERELSDNTSMSLTPYMRHTDMDFSMDFFPATAIERNQHTSLGLLAKYTMDLDGGHKVIFGTDLEYTEGQLSEVQNEPAVFAFIPGVHYDYEVDATVIAPYVHSEWQLLENTRLVAGLRYERTEYDYTNNTNSREFGTRYLRPDDRTDTFNNVSPKLGLVQQLTEDTSAFINYARGSRAPQTTDLYRAQQTPTERGGRADSEEMDSIEIGVRKVGDGLQYEAVAYHMKKRDYFFTGSDDTNVPDGKTNHTGLELGMFYPFNDQFDIAANLTFAKHEYDFNRDSSDPDTVIVDGNYLVTAPKRMANIRLGWNPTDVTRAELEWVHMSEYYVNDANNAKYEGHDVFNLRASHQVTPQLKIYGALKNVFNTDYAERADYNTNIGQDADRYRYFVGQRRYLHVGARYSF